MANVTIKHNTLQEMRLCTWGPHSNSTVARSLHTQAVGKSDKNITLKVNTKQVITFAYVMGKSDTNVTLNTNTKEIISLDMCYGKIGQKMLL